MLRAGRLICVAKASKSDRQFSICQSGHVWSIEAKGVACCVLAACLDMDPFELPDMDSGLVPLLDTKSWSVRYRRGTYKAQLLTATTHQQRPSGAMHERKECARL